MPNCFESGPVGSRTSSACLANSGILGDGVALLGAGVDGDTPIHLKRAIAWRAREQVGVES